MLGVGDERGIVAAGKLNVDDQEGCAEQHGGEARDRAPDTARAPAYLGAPVGGERPGTQML
jgi:hypothetical protein